MINNGPSSYEELVQLLRRPLLLNGIQGGREATFNFPKT